MFGPGHNPQSRSCSLGNAGAMNFVFQLGTGVPPPVSGVPFYPLPIQLLYNLQVENLKFTNQDLCHSGIGRILSTFKCSEG